MKVESTPEESRFPKTLDYSAQVTMMLSTLKIAMLSGTITQNDFWELKHRYYVL